MQNFIFNQFLLFFLLKLTYTLKVFYNFYSTFKNEITNEKLSSQTKQVTQELSNSRNKRDDDDDPANFHLEVHKNFDTYKMILNTIKKPSVCDIEAQKVLVRLSPIEITDTFMKNSESILKTTAEDNALNYEEILFKCENVNYTLELANETENIFNQVYTGDANEITLKDLNPSARFFIR